MNLPFVKLHVMFLTSRHNFVNPNKLENNENIGNLIVLAKTTPD